MLLRYYEEGHLRPIDFDRLADSALPITRICLLSLDELADAPLPASIGTHLRPLSSRSAAVRLESYDRFDRLDLQPPDPLACGSGLAALSIYLTPTQLIAAYRPCGSGDPPSLLPDHLPGNPSPASVLLLLLEALSRQDAEQLGGIEREIAELEDALLQSRRLDYIGRIIDLRKRLLAICFYYGQLCDLFDELEAEDNQFVGHKHNHFHNLEKRVDRLQSAAVRLRDYLSQVREAYQSQTDIELNQLMKIFTVITTIFLPLTLVTGWYGMNFVMPEYQWAYSYPVVIVLCLVILLGCVWFFKKKRWF